MVKPEILPTLNNQCYKLYVKKHDQGIILNKIPHFDEPDLEASENVIDVPLMYLNVEVNENVSNYVADKDVVIKKDDHVVVDEDEDIPCANRVKRIIENITKSYDKATQEKDKEVVDVDEETETDEEHVVTMMKSIYRKDRQVSLVNSKVNDVVSNVGDNIDYVVNDPVSADGGSIPKNNEFHDGSALVNEGVTKDVGLSKRNVEDFSPQLVVAATASLWER
ncbi:unnamed protein product [Vicia faba]|uniref:Uncharacterized protein n=1 Tax=Vicia faba TaxID=3906 RepID=A0AAV1A908_VICFA|nr:unnamed protein product [Vicia faba]